MPECILLVESLAPPVDTPALLCRNDNDRDKLPVGPTSAGFCGLGLAVRLLDTLVTDPGDAGRLPDAIGDHCGRTGAPPFRNGIGSIGIGVDGIGSPMHSFDAGSCCSVVSVKAVTGRRRAATPGFGLSVGSTDEVAMELAAV